MYGVVTLCTCVILLVEYSSIDWHDFVVVETINFRENETGNDQLVMLQYYHIHWCMMCRAYTRAVR